MPNPQIPQQDPAHDVLAAEMYAVPAPDPALLDAEAHDVLAAEEFAMPAPDPTLHHPPVVTARRPDGSRRGPRRARGRGVRDARPAATSRRGAGPRGSGVLGRGPWWRALPRSLACVQWRGRSAAARPLRRFRVRLSGHLRGPKNGAVKKGQQVRPSRNPPLMWTRLQFFPLCGQNSRSMPVASRRIPQPRFSWNPVRRRGGCLPPSLRRFSRLAPVPSAT